MNRFKVKKDRAEDFEKMWRTRKSHLNELPGFRGFNLLKCDSDSNEEYNLFSSHVIWESKEDFLYWTKSQQFRDSHKNAGDSKAMLLEPAHFEGFVSLQSE